MEKIEILKNVYYYDDDDEEGYNEYNVTFECKGKRFIAIHRIAGSAAWNDKIIGYESNDFKRLNKGGMELVSFERTTFTEEELVEAAELLLFSKKEELFYWDKEGEEDEEANRLRKELEPKKSTDGFNICLQDFCSYCGEFEPEIARTDISQLEDSTRRFITDIHCVYETKCLHVASMLRERLDNG